MKILRYASLALLPLLFASCGNSWLDLEPATYVDTDGAISRVGEVPYALNGVYDAMQHTDLYSGRVVYYADVTGDDMQSTSTTKRTADYYLFNFHAGNGPSTHWTKLYSLIQSCNTILSLVDDLPLEGATEEERADYKGQALTLRALALFDLTRIYGYPYLKDKGASWGVPIVTTLLTIDDKPARNTVAECYTQIIGDLTTAVPMMSGSYNKGRINKWGAMGLLGRIYLYKGEDDKALRTTEEAIAGAEAEGYRLWTNAEYASAWGADASADNKGEVLFEIVNLTTDSPGKESLGYLNSAAGYSDCIITSSFYDLRKQDPDDVRLKILSNDRKRYAYVNKYVPQAGETLEDANIPLIRLSELYLNAAEAALKEKDNDKAVKYLDAIVRRANPANTVAGETLTLDRILTERRKELVGEGHRLYDAMRNGLKCHRYDVPSKDISRTEHLVGTYPTEYEWNYSRIVLPIPKGEMDTNPNMIQNP
ncbi:MAG: RagB/SusD family nutrient uptake outer membrane protein, partial [Prevotellaceae bacterium]|nr:RagB/SusD family nutrient uptake outer membrane protein [Prevotellaceae bacterium]